MIQLTLTLKMVVETSVTVNNNCPIQDYVHPDDQTQPFEIVIIIITIIIFNNDNKDSDGDNGGDIGDVK